MILLAVAAAWATPDRVADTLTDTISVVDLAVPSSGDLVAWTDGSGTVYVYTTDGWIGTYGTSDCATSSGVAIVVGSGQDTVLVGCDDGRVLAWDVDDLGRISSGEYDLLTVASGGAVYALETDDTDVFVVADDGSGSLEVDGYALTDGSELTDAYPQALSYDTVTDTILIDGSLFVVHDTNKLSKVDTATGGTTVPNENLSGRTFVDGWAYSSGTVYLADTSGSVVKFNGGDNDLQVQLSEIADSVEGVVGNSDEGYFLASTGTELLVYGFTSGSPDTTTTSSIAEAGVGEMVTSGSYVLGATDAGVAVLTDVPWVYDVSLSSTVAAKGQDLTLTFTSDTAGSYSVKKGSTDELAAGEVAAGESVTVDFTVDSTYEEGTTRVYVYVTSTAGTGVGAADLDVNNPPSSVGLSAEDVTPGDEAIHIHTGTFSEADIAYVDVYLSTADFDPSYYSIGGPPYSGPDGKENPISFAVTAGVTSDVTVQNLTNGTPYYVAVRARDTSGLESTMSDVYSVTPDETYTMAELAGDDSGFGCASAKGTVTVLGALAGLFAARRRRAGGLVVATALLFTPGLAHAREPDLTSRHWNIAVRYGPYLSQDEPYLTDSFGDSGNSLFRLDYGWCSQFFEVDFGTGLYRDNGYLLMQDGSTSGDETLLTEIPLNLDAVLRLDIWDDSKGRFAQPIVPYARIGGDYLIWVQDWQENPGDDTFSSRSGGKLGWHYAFGGMILLDWLDRSSAGELEANTGINDTWLVVEYRSTQMLHPDSQLDFSEKDLTFGLQFDF